MNFLGYRWQPIEHLRKHDLTEHDEEAQRYISQWMCFMDNYDSASLWKLNTLKILPLEKEKGDNLETAYLGEPMGIKYPLCGLSTAELNL